MRPFGRAVALAWLAGLALGCAGGRVGVPSPPDSHAFGSVEATTSPPPRSSADLTGAIETVVARVAPSIVHLSGAMPPRAKWPRVETFDGMPLRLLRAGPLGSGVVVRGFVVTSRHVIERVDQLRAHLADGRVVRATVVHRDVERDLAVLRLEGETHELRWLPLADPAVVRRGEVVLAIGNPYGLGYTVSMGVVSSTGAAGVDGEHHVQTDAAINHENAGGALVNLRGELIGIANAKLTDRRRLRGIAYATPIDAVRTVLGRMSQEGLQRSPRQVFPAVAYALRGISTADVDEDTRARFQLSANLDHGAVVTAVEPKTPAAKLGIEPGDVILEIDLTPIVDAETFQRASIIEGPRLLLLLRGDAAVYLLAPP